MLAGANDLVALDAATGAAVWTRPHPGAVGTRGINYWRSADGHDRRLIYIADGYLTAVDAKTGQTVPTFGRDGRVDLRTGLAATGRSIDGLSPLQTSNPGRVFENLIIVSLPRCARDTTPIPATCRRTTCARAPYAGSSGRCPATAIPERTRGRKARAPATAASTTGAS